MHDGEETDILKRDALGRVTLKREKREALMEQFERSGLKGVAFARLAGINYGTFASWVQHRRHARGEYGSKARTEAVLAAPRQVQLLQVASAREPSTPTSATAGLDVLLPGGGSLRITDAAQVPLVVSLIQALRASC
jgi:alpha-beta hydrolase superfamily lysophospholipase